MRSVRVVCGNYSGLPLAYIGEDSYIVSLKLEADLDIPLFDLRLPFELLTGISGDGGYGRGNAAGNELY